MRVPSLRRVANFLGVDDLRFPSRADEDLYRAHLDPQLQQTCIVAGILHVVGITYAWLPIYLSEAARRDRQFRWGCDDPRTLYFALSILMKLISGTCVVVCVVQKRYKCFKAYVGELSVVVMTSNSLMVLPFVSRWHTAPIYGSHDHALWEGDTTDSELIVMYLMAMSAAMCSVFFPIRVYVIRYVLVLATCLFAVVLLAFGSPFPETRLFRIFCLTTTMWFMHKGSHQLEQHVREKWRALAKVEKTQSAIENYSASAEGMQALAQTICDIVMRVGKDLRCRDTCPWHDAFFGRTMEGRLFTEVVANSDEDRFIGLLQRASASKVPELMPVTITARRQRQLNVNLLVFNTRSEQLGYIVGIRVDDESEQSAKATNGSPSESYSAVEDHDMVMPLPFSAQTSLHSGNKSATKHEGGGDRDDRSSHFDPDAVSNASTTEAGREFSDFVRIFGMGDLDNQVRCRLERLSELGVKEHWLLCTSEVYLQPEQILGFGTFGVVVAGWMHGTPVAVKLPQHPDKNNQFKRLPSHVNELRILRHIRHRNCVLFYGACIDPQTTELALVFEYVRGKPLSSYITVPVAPYDDTHARSTILIDVCSALRYLHSQTPAIVHGDLNPSNILIDRGPCAKLVDFGLSRVLTKHVAPMGGTLFWKAPEIIHMPGTMPSPCADVFSFGRVAYFVVTGLTPCVGMDRKTIQRNSRKGTGALQWPPKVPFLAECRALCDCCLQPVANMRPNMTAVQRLIISWLPEPIRKGDLGIPDAATAADWGTRAQKSWNDGLHMVRESVNQLRAKHEMSGAHSGAAAPAVVAATDQSSVLLAATIGHLMELMRHFRTDNFTEALDFLKEALSLMVQNQDSYQQRYIRACKAWTCPLCHAMNDSDDDPCEICWLGAADGASQMTDSSDVEQGKPARQICAL